MGILLKSTKVYTAFFLWATHFGKRTFGIKRFELLSKDLREIGLKMNYVSKNSSS